MTATVGRVFPGALKLVPRHKFETLANQLPFGAFFSHRIPMGAVCDHDMAQLAGRNSLRDIVENFSAQAHHLYHLGNVKLSCSNLSRIDNGKPFALYQVLFGKLLSRCQRIVAPSCVVLQKTTVFAGCLNDCFMSVCFPMG